MDVFFPSYLRHGPGLGLLCDDPKNGLTLNGKPRPSVVEIRLKPHAKTPHLLAIYLNRAGGSFGVEPGSPRLVLEGSGITYSAAFPKPEVVQSITIVIIPDDMEWHKFALTATDCTGWIFNSVQITPLKG